MIIEITDDFGDYLLKSGRVSQIEYNQKMERAEMLLEAYRCQKMK